MTTVRVRCCSRSPRPTPAANALWEVYRRHDGQDADPVLVWQADTRSINPAVHPQLIADAYAAADIAAAAEYLAEFHRDIEGFVSREAGDAVVARGGREFCPCGRIATS